MCELQLRLKLEGGEYGCIGVHLRPYVLNIKRGRKHGEALLVPRKNYQYLAMCGHQLRLKLERGEYGCIDVYISSALSTDYKKRPKTWRSFISSSKELSVSGYVWSSAETEAGKGKVWLHRCVSSALCTEYKKRQKTWRSLSCPEKNYQFLAMCELQLRLKLERGEYGCIDVYISSALSTDYKKRPKTWRSFISSSKELSVSGYVWSSAETEAGKGKVWLHRCVSSALCTEYKKRQKTWRSFTSPRNTYQYLAMCEHQLRLKLERGSMAA
jgi:hypothetical protein